MFTEKSPGCFAICLIRLLLALTQPEIGDGSPGVPVNSGTTISPATPGAPLWMCPSVGLSIPWNEMLKHTCFFAFFSLKLASPEPSGSPGGTSTAPTMSGANRFTVFFFFPAAAPPASAKTSAIELRPTMMASSPLRLGICILLLGSFAAQLTLRSYESAGRSDDRPASGKVPAPDDAPARQPG